MDFNALTAELKTQRLAARVYRRGGQNRFRDEITLGQNGKVLFQRFNYGEAAGLVFSMWGNAAGNAIAWDLDKVDYGRKDEAPAQLAGEEADGALKFEDIRDAWAVQDTLKSWPAGGLSRLKLMFGK